MNDISKLAKPVRKLTSLVRPKYSPGLLLQDDDLTAGVNYTRHLSRMMFRTLFGCGVVCGMVVDKPVLKCGKLTINVGKGMALSCAGDPIEVPATQEIMLDPCSEEIPDTLWIAVKHIETFCEPRAALCPPDEDEPPAACTRESDGFELRAFAERPPCSCGCKMLPPVPVAAAEAPAAKSKAVTAKAAAKTAKARAEAAAVTGAALEDNTGGSLFNERTRAASNDAPEGCYFPFYDGQCPCASCDCEWIVLAVATRKKEAWSVDHSVRRFVRPVLMRDPQVARERTTPSA